MSLDAKYVEIVKKIAEKREDILDSYESILLSEIEDRDAEIAILEMRNYFLQKDYDKLRSKLYYYEGMKYQADTASAELRKLEMEFDNFKDSKSYKWWAYWRK